jgi:tRNA A-37 threonylcarbamoyl transferase component Bud32
MEDAESRAKTAVKRLAKPRRGQLVETDYTDLITPIPDLGLVLRLPGLDERLHGLKFLHEPETIAPKLSQHVDAAMRDGGQLDADLLGHRLGKRCTARFRFETANGATASTSVVAKMYKYHSDRGRQVTMVTKELRCRGFGDDSPIRVPRPIAYLSDECVVLMEDVLGAPVSCLVNVDPVAGVKAAGRALAKLHRSPLPVAARHTIVDEISLLERWVDLVSEMDATASQAMIAALAKVRSKLAQWQGVEPTLVHRDFYEKQVAVSGQQTYLIDFDTLAIGDPALDLGNFLAHLRLAELQGRGHSESLSEAFLEAYGDSFSPGLARRVEAYTRSSALRLACLNSFSTRWRGLTQPLLDGVL